MAGIMRVLSVRSGSIPCPVASKLAPFVIRSMSVGLFLMCVWPGAAGGAAEPSTSVPATAIPSWLALKQSSRPITGSAAEVYDKLETDPKSPAYGTHRIRHSAITFWLEDQYDKVTIDQVDKSGQWRRRVLATNPDYAFVAGEAAPNGPYFIRDCGRDSAMRDQVQEDMKWIATYAISLPYGIDSDFRSLPELVKSDGFRLLSCKAGAGAQKNLVEMAFEFKPIGHAAELNDRAQMRATFNCFLYEQLG